MASHTASYKSVLGAILAGLSIASICFSLAACRRLLGENPPYVTTEALVQAGRDYAHGVQHGVQQAAPGNGTPAVDIDSSEHYEKIIRVFVEHEGFDQLEAAAYKARVWKGRLIGGYWKLRAFYEAVGHPLHFDRPTESEWKDHIAFIKKWVATRPESATPRIALAESYLNYAWDARGEGYAHTVSSERWELVEQRVGLAKAALLDASHLKEKCPYWYEVGQQISLLDGWNKVLAREFYEQAIAFDPTYDNFTLNYGYYLLPKWDGEEGETRALAEEAAARLGEPQGSILYYEMATLFANEWELGQPPMQGMSWQRVKQGHAAHHQLYGIGGGQRNGFALLAYSVGDKEAAKEAFAEIGSDWSNYVWRSAESFDRAKTWANSDEPVAAQP